MLVPERLTRYGEDPAPRPYGIETTSIEPFTSPDSPQCISSRVVHWVVESVRHTWEIVFKKKANTGREVFAERTKSAQPWTSVNNCTTSVHPLEVAMEVGIFTLSKSKGLASACQEDTKDDLVARSC